MCPLCVKGKFAGVVRACGLRLAVAPTSVMRLRLRPAPSHRSEFLKQHSHVLGLVKQLSLREVLPGPKRSYTWNSRIPKNSFEQYTWNSKLKINLRQNTQVREKQRLEAVRPGTGPLMADEGRRLPKEFRPKSTADVDEPDCNRANTGQSPLRKSALN